MDLRSPCEDIKIVYSYTQNSYQVNEKLMLKLCLLKWKNDTKMQCPTEFKKQSFEWYIYVCLIKMCNYIEPRGFLLLTSTSGCKSWTRFALWPIELVCAIDLRTRMSAQKSQLMRAKFCIFFSSFSSLDTFDTWWIVTVYLML